MGLPVEEGGGGGQHLQHLQQQQPLITNNDHILPSLDPFQHEQVVADVDLGKAQEFASHFGKYSYDEIEHMRNGKLEI